MLSLHAAHRCCCPPCSVHNVTAEHLLQHQDQYYCNWPVKGVGAQPDFRMKDAPHAGIYMSDVRRHSDAASVKRLMETQWPSEWEDAWQDLSTHPEAWLDYRDFKVTNNRPTFPDFKPRDPASEFGALWVNPPWDKLVAGLKVPKAP